MHVHFDPEQQLAEEAEALNQLNDALKIYQETRQPEAKAEYLKALGNFSRLTLNSRGLML